jgi:hypothetical protein
MMSLMPLRRMGTAVGGALLLAATTLLALKAAPAPFLQAELHSSPQPCSAYVR